MSAFGSWLASRPLTRAALLVPVLAATVLVAATEPGRACSCVPPDPWSYLARADGAFVGRLVSRRESGDGKAILRFDVERAVKGGIGKTVKVETASSGSSCGIETTVGRRIGLFLVRAGDTWTGHLCWQVEPEDLLAATSLPAPDGRGAVALLVGGRFGPARTMALDAKGRTLAYGMGTGRVSDFSMCPGGGRLVELVELGDPGLDTPVVAVRELPSLRLIRQQPVKAAFPGPVRCAAAEGDRIVIFVGSGPDLGNRARLLRVTPTRTSAIWRGWGFHASITHRRAYVTDVNVGLVAVDLRDGSVTKLAPMPKEAFYLTPDPARTRFASLAQTEGVGNPRLVVVDIRRHPASVRKISLPNSTGAVMWLADGRLAVLQNPTALVFGPNLRIVGRFRWLAQHGAIIDPTAFGVHGLGRLVAAKLPSGPTRLMRRLPGRPYVIVRATR